MAPDIAKSDLESSTSASETELRHTGNTFSGSGLKSRFYKPIEKYEGHHRYDPDFEWEPEEERKVVRKVRPSSCPGLESRVLIVYQCRLTKESALGFA